jgi:hypothetical protein
MFAAHDRSTTMNSDDSNTIAMSFCITTSVSRIRILDMATATSRLLHCQWKTLRLIEPALIAAQGTLFVYQARFGSNPDADAGCKEQTTAPLSLAFSG